MPEKLRYVAGGTVQAAGGVYLERPADAELLKLCRNRELVHILTSRQMGKSSLMIRTAESLAAENILPVIVDLQPLGSANEPQAWFRGVLIQISDQLGIGVDVADWWNRQETTPTHRFTLFLEQVVLAEISAPIVIFVDEIDTTLKLPFSPDFFAAIRYLYLARASREDLARLSFVLIGVATTTSLISDPDRTPFNIGRQLQLTDFTAQEAIRLCSGLPLSADEAAEVLAAVLAWTGGHPYLTLRVFESLSTQHPERWDQPAIEKRVRQLFLDPSAPRDSNIEFVRDMLTQTTSGTDRASVLRTYIDVRKNRPVPDEERSPAKTHLKLAGVVRQDRGLLRVRNRIYEQSFDVAWAKRHFPPDFRRYRRAIVVLTVALLVAGSVIFYIVNLLRRAHTAEDLALSRKLLSDSQVVEATQPSDLDLSVLLAIEAMRLVPLPQVMEQLEKTTRLLPMPVARLDHPGPVTKVKFSPDHQRVATIVGSEVRIWGPWRQTPVVLPHGGVVNAIAFSPNGLWIATASADGKARVWDLAGALAFEMPHEDAVNDVAFSPDGSWIASAGDDRNVRIWEARKGGRVRSLEHGGCVFQVAFSADGKFLGSVSDDRGAHIWEVETGRERAQLRHSGPVNAIQIYTEEPTASPVRAIGKHATLPMKPEPRRYYAATAGLDGVCLWTLPEGKRLGSCQSEQVATVKMTKTAVAADGNVYRWYPKTGLGSLVTTLRGFAEFLSDGLAGSVCCFATAGADHAAEFLENYDPRNVYRMIHRDVVRSADIASLSGPPDSQSRPYFATAADDHAARIWNAPSALGFIGSEDDRGAFTSDGRLVAWSDGLSLRVRSTPFHAPPVVLDRRSRPEIVWLEFSTDGNWLAAVTGRSIEIWSVPDARLHFEVDRQLRGQVFTAFSGQDLVVRTPDALEVWDVRSRMQIAKHPFTEPLAYMRPSADGREIALIDASNRVYLLHRSGSRLQSSPSDIAGPIGALAFSADSRTMAVCTESRAVVLINSETGRETRRLPLDSPCRALAFHPSKPLVAVATRTAMKILDVWTGAQPAGLLSLTGYISALGFSPDGQEIGVISGVVQIWNVGRSELVYSNSAGPTFSGGVILTADGKFLFSGAARVYLRDKEDLIRQACGHLTRNLTAAERRQYLPGREWTPPCAIPDNIAARDVP